ncbi:hypothetical protein PP180_08815 [Muricauda sp. SK9]|uniref:hypothetical protein n=1 Tax=Flavobacteriaceae TaxID=49546 RepID=UPI0011C36F1C|nr:MULTISPECIES: hypothetical protein [Allomuricauda]MDC6385467.1 hypothetical protein [Muricauda sp. SK9]
MDNRFYKYDGEIFGETLHYNQYCRAETAGRTYYELAVEESTTAPVKEDKGVFVYGLGDYSRVYIAPNLSKSAKMFCVDYSYQLAKNYAEKFGYKNFGLVPKDSYPYLENTVYPLAIIATYHSDHTRIAKEIFKKNEDTIIFIEKPPCVTITDIDDLIGLYNSGAKLEIGYNRRYIPICRTIRKRIFQHQKVITISVKEILISKNHWYFWENQGTRITGNLTHWIDLSNYWIKGHPIEINLLDSNSEDETLSASILYSEGSLVNLTVSDKGNSLRGVQEFIEIRTKDETYFIKDFVSVTTYHKTGKKSISKKRIRNKGHDKMYIDLLSTYKNRARAFYEKEDMIKTGLTTFFMSKMYRENIRNLNIARDMDVYLKK